MEDESYVQESRKRALGEENGGHDTNKRFNGGSDKPTLKLLITNLMAGKLIGKGGANIGQLQSQFNASIHISHNKDFFPGTMDRIVSISADIDQIREFINYLLAEAEQNGKTEGSNPILRQEIKLLISDVAAGLVIGKGGVSIKAIQAASNGGRVYISKKEESMTGERILVISGETLQCAAACKQVLEVMSAQPDKMSNNNTSYSLYTNPIHMSQNNPPFYNHQAVNNMSLRNSYSNYKPKSDAKAKFQVEMEIPDQMVGTILGRQGQTIMDFSRSSGAKLQFSGKDEFVPGTTDRILTITGGMYQVQNAYILVDNKLAQVQHEFKE